MPNTDVVEDEISSTAASAALWQQYARNNAMAIIKRQNAARKSEAKKLRKEQIISPGFQTYTRDDYPNFWGF